MTRKYVLDTNALSDFINQRNGVSERADHELRRGYRVGTCTPVIGELIYGLELTAKPEENLKKARRAMTKLVVWPFDRAAAEVYGTIAAELKRIGRPMQQIDIQLAAIARLIGATVVTTDSDLSAVPGLTVENWASPSAAASTT